MKRLSLLSFAAVVALAGRVAAADNEIPKEARAAFEKAEEFELYSLDPARDLGGKKVEALHGWKVLGKVTVKGADAKRVRQAVEKGVKDSDGSVAACFNPRHGIRVTNGTKTYDLVICYECLSASVFVGDDRVGSFLTARGPEGALNKVLRDAKVPLPKGQD
jgi:hypothetical protein